MGNEVISNTDMSYINELLTVAGNRAFAVRNKAFELNNRTVADAPKTDEEQPKTPDVGTEIKEKLSQINNILNDALAALEAFV